MAASHYGKGSSPRPFTNKDKYNENWDKIFGKKDTKDEKYPVGIDSNWGDDLEELKERIPFVYRPS